MGALFVEAANRFLVKLKDQKVIERQTAEFRCETKVRILRNVKSNEQTPQETKTPAIWMVDGKRITHNPSGKYQTSSRSGVHTLTIQKAELVDENTYHIEQAGIKGAKICLNY